MNFRTVGAVAALLIGVAGPRDLATAQYYPSPQAYPAQAYPPPPPSYPPYRAAPGLEDDDDPLYDPPMVQRRPLPPIAGGGGQAGEPLAARSARGAPVDPDDQVELLPPPPGYSYRVGPQGYE